MSDTVREYPLPEDERAVKAKGADGEYPLPEDEEVEGTEETTEGGGKIPPEAYYLVNDVIGADGKPIHTPSIFDDPSWAKYLPDGAGEVADEEEDADLEDDE